MACFLGIEMHYLEPRKNGMSKWIVVFNSVMPRMGLYLLRVGARLKGISPFSNDLKFGIFAHLM